MYQKVDFAQWLLKEMQARGISQAELARRASVSRATVSKTLKQKSFPSWEVCLAFAHGLDLPPEIVLRAATLLPEERQDNGRVEEEIIRYKVKELSDEQAGELIKYIEFMQDRDERPKRKDLVDRYTREGETPPEVVKK